jgi:hypothetical protein
MWPRLLPLFLLSMAAPAFSGDVLPFIENDFEKAMARARTMDVPLFVEAWAPW